MGDVLVEIQVHIIFVANEVIGNKIKGVVALQNTYLTTFYQRIQLSDELVSRLVLYNAVRLLPGNTVDNIFEMLHHGFHLVACDVSGFFQEQQKHFHANLQMGHCFGNPSVALDAAFVKVISVVFKDCL